MSRWTVSRWSSSGGFGLINWFSCSQTTCRLHFATFYTKITNVHIESTMCKLWCLETHNVFSVSKRTATIMSRRLYGPRARLFEVTFENLIIYLGTLLFLRIACFYYCLIALVVAVIPNQRRRRSSNTWMGGVSPPHGRVPRAVSKYIV